MNYLEAWVNRHKVSQLIVIVVVVIVAVSLTAGFLQEVPEVRLEIFIINQITEKTRLLLHLLLHHDARGCEAVDGQPVGDLVEADAVEEVVLAVQVELASFGGQTSATGAGGGWGGVELGSGPSRGPDQGVEQSRAVWGGLGFNGGVDVESVDKFHQAVELALLSDHIAGVEEMQQGLDERSFNFRQHQLERLVVLHAGGDLVQPGRLEELLEEGRGHGEHHLVGRDHAVLALDVNINVLLEISRGKLKMLKKFLSP